LIVGHFLGESGMVSGPKHSLFHGCKDDVRESIVENGFDDKYSSAACAFGAGLYFSPQSCKAWSYAQKYLLLCEVALGDVKRQWVLEDENRELNYQKVFLDKEKAKRGTGMHSVIFHPNPKCRFNHEERIVYKNTQCKPVYLIETTTCSPGGGV